MATGFAAVLAGMLVALIGFTADRAAAYEGGCTPTTPSSGTCVLDETSGNDPRTWGTMTYSRTGDVMTFTFNAAGPISSIQACFNVTAAYPTSGQSCVGSDNPQYSGGLVDPLVINLAAPPSGNAIAGFDPGDPVFFSIHVTQGGRTTYGIGGASAAAAPPAGGGGPVVAPTPSPTPTPTPAPTPTPVTPPATEVGGVVVTPEVTPAPVAPAAPTQVEGVVVERTLPATGANDLQLIQLGLGLVLLGVGTMLFARERTALI